MAISRTVGARIKRREDPRLITGSSSYVDDIKLQDMLHLAILRSVYAHARIRKIDASKALALPGVVAVLTGEDVRQVSAESGRTTVFVTHSADEAAFLGSRIVVLTRRPGKIALDLPVDLPRSGVDAHELRRSPEYLRLRTDVSEAVKLAAA